MATEPIDDDNPIEEILLNGFPNPDRIGCLGPDVIQALAQRRLGRDDPAWRHIWNCSPCFKDFKELRDKRLAALERQQSSQRNRRLLALAAALACVAVLGFLLFSRNKGNPSGDVNVVAIDLTNAGTFRGETTQDDSRVFARLPSKLDEIHLTLPRLSREGRYIIAILRSKSEDGAVALGSAIASGREDNTSLVLKLDLSSTKPGRYYLATRMEEQGKQDAAYYYPVLIGQQ